MMDYFSVKVQDGSVKIMNSHQFTEFIKAQTLAKIPVSYEVLNFFNCKSVTVQVDTPTQP